MPQLPRIWPLKKILCTLLKMCPLRKKPNYKGCKTYKELQNNRHSTKQNNGNKTNKVNFNFKFNNCESSQRPTQTTNTTPDPSYAQATSTQTPTPSSQNMNNDLTSFSNNFQAIINPLIALLTTVLDRLLSNNFK